MTKFEYAILVPGDYLINKEDIKTTAGSVVMIPAGTKHVVQQAGSRILVTQTADEAKVDCAFTIDHALQLLQVYARIGD